MTQQVPQQAAENEFDAAKIIVETLKQLDPQQQGRAIRFACETLGLRAQGLGASGMASSPGDEHPDTDARLPLRQSPQVDIKQFTGLKSPKSDQQFAAVVAYYYQFEAPDNNRKEVITAGDLKEAIRLVNWPRPGDANMTLNNAKNAGYLDSAGRGKFKINTVGENLVAVTLPGNGGEASLARKTGNRKAIAAGKGSKKKPAKRGN